MVRTRFVESPAEVISQKLVAGARTDPKACQKDSEYMPDRMLGRMPRISDRMSEYNGIYMWDRMSEYMSDGMSVGGSLKESKLVSRKLIHQQIIKHMMWCNLAKSGATKTWQPCPAARMLQRRTSPGPDIRWRGAPLAAKRGAARSRIWCTSSERTKKTPEIRRLAAAEGVLWYCCCRCCCCLLREFAVQAASQYNYRAANWLEETSAGHLGKLDEKHWFLQVSCTCSLKISPRVKRAVSKTLRHPRCWLEHCC